LQCASGWRRVPIVSNVRDVLKHWRGNLTQETVAATAKVTARTVANWEHGVGAPGIEQVRALERLKPGLISALGLRGGKTS